MLDLKPANLLFDDDESIVIADFGTSSVPEITVTQTRMEAGGGGTAPYMAPEQFRPTHFGEVNEKADIWALGVIITVLC